MVSRDRASRRAPGGYRKPPMSRVRPPRAPTTHISSRPLLHHRQLRGAPIHLQPDRPLRPPLPRPAPTQTETAEAGETIGRVTAVGRSVEPPAERSVPLLSPGRNSQSIRFPPARRGRRNSSKGVSGGNTHDPPVSTLTNITHSPRSRFKGRENPATTRQPDPFQLLQHLCLGRIRQQTTRCVLEGHGLLEAVVFPPDRPGTEQLH